MVKGIGKLIKNLRIERGFSQEDIANFLHCSREQVSKIELDKRTLTNESLYILSNTLKFDFVTLSKNSEKYNSIDHYILCNRLIDTIIDRNIIEMQQLLESPEVLTEFDYGNPRILKLYCSSLVETNLNNNIEKSIEFCKEILEIEDLSKISMFTPKLEQENRYYSTILQLGVNLQNNNDIISHKILLENTIEFLEQYYFNTILPSSSISFFMKKLYVSMLNNYATLLFKMQQYMNALCICEKAIEISSTYNSLYMLEFLLQLKIEILCSQNLLKDAKEAYAQLSGICTLSKNLNWLTKTNNLIKEHYPQLLDFIK